MTFCVFVIAYSQLCYLHTHIPAGVVHTSRIQCCVVGAHTVLSSIRHMQRNSENTHTHTQILIISTVCTSTTNERHATTKSNK